MGYLFDGLREPMRRTDVVVHVDHDGPGVGGEVPADRIVLLGVTQHEGATVEWTYTGAVARSWSRG